MPKYTQPRKTWQYSKEFKVKAVQLSLIEGIQVQEVANTLDIHPFMLSRWRKEYRSGKYQHRLLSKGIRPSMSRKENCWDSAAMEAFFARLKV
jgi:transposase-like protein